MRFFEKDLSFDEARALLESEASHLDRAGYRVDLRDYDLGVAVPETANGDDEWVYLMIDNSTPHPLGK